MKRLLLAVVSMLVAGTAAAEPSGPLVDTQWRLVEFQSMDDAQGITRPDEHALYSLSLHGDGSASLQLGCNRVTASWSAQQASDATSGHFELGAVEGVSAVCPPTSLEKQILSQAGFIRSYLLKEGRLYMSLMADGGIYAWAPNTGGWSAADVPAAPEQGGPRNWEVMTTLNLRAQPNTSAPVLTQYAAGALLDNLGCQQGLGRYWCDVQQLGGGPRGYVAAEYLRPAVSPDGSVALGPDDSALRAGQGEYDATGMLPCGQHTGQPMGQCEFGVARAGGGYATVVIHKPDGRTRAIFFRMGIPISADVSESEGYLKFGATKEDDLHRIRVGSERYEIPDAVVLGG
ncbi:META domain-containing protein [Marinobacterium sp. AK62]|uniref:META domain-containing protein n=1 Tax=Marinobacterium alkalitolerans TaxID=1542925 RepID=A0ABS3ZDA5_9GAMM|nr:SH3 domain-containing protein [Marinobacterium alkalitolerans]MBP0049273.1 META domain-containing protein [Marinobacterium alkalitolerans]